MLTLANLDSLYNSTISKMPIDSRLWYCNYNLDKLQLIIANNNQKLDKQQKEKLKEMIEAIQHEIKRLNEKN